MLPVYTRLEKHSLSGRETPLGDYREAHCTSVLEELSVNSSCPALEWAASDMHWLPGPVGRWSPFREVCGDIPVLGGNSVDSYSNSEDFLFCTE